MAMRLALEGQLSRTQAAKASAKSAGLIRFIRMVSQRSPGDAVLVGQVPAEEVEVRSAPCGDVLVVVAVGDGAADHEQQHFRQRMQDPPNVARVFDVGEVVEQRREARLLGQAFGEGHARLRVRAAASIQRNPILSPVT
jgi:hypothetical protein